MKQILADRDIRLTKSLGQNFLHDANQLRRIVAAADLKKSDQVLEIGPGLGPLTELLVEQAGEVLAIEKDGKLVDALRLRFNTGQETELGTGGAPVLRLLHDDALDYLRCEARDWSGWKLVANLPYSVASPILVELAWGGRACSRAKTAPENGPREDACPREQPAVAGCLGRGPQRMVATLQIEVAKRLFAKPGTPDYGLLTLMVQLDYEPHSWFKIPASCFFPEPDVDSACVCLVRRADPLLAPEQREIFARIIKRSFSQRRKMMLKLLKADWSKEDLERAFGQLQLSLSTRAESVTLKQFAALTQWLNE